MATHVEAYTEGQLARLPKWARRELAYQNMRLKEANQRIAELEAALGGGGDGPFGLGRPMREDTLWLPKHQDSIAMRIGPGPSPFEVDLRTGRHVQGQGLQVMVTSHHTLLIRPQAANVVHIEPGRWPS